MITILSVLITIGFITGAYYMGNYSQDTFGRSWERRVWSTFFGLIIWVGIFAASALIGLFFWGVHSLLTELL